METTLRLHYAPDNASLIVRLALEELGVAYETVLVDRARNEQSSAAYRAINPAGLIPALETPQGPISETAAILLWLSDTYGGLAPSPEDSDRAAFLKWVFYLSNTMHANLRMTFYPWKYVGDNAETQKALCNGARTNIADGLGLLEKLAAEGHSWFAGATPSALDLYVSAMLRWMALYPAGDTDWFRLEDWPNLYRLAATLETRPSVIALCTAEGMSHRPLTKPQAPNPPEGVAL